MRPRPTVRPISSRGVPREASAGAPDARPSRELELRLLQAVSELERVREQAAQLAQGFPRLRRAADRRALHQALAEELRELGCACGLLTREPDGELGLSFLSHSPRQLRKGLRALRTPRAPRSTALASDASRAPLFAELLESDEPVRPVRPELFLRALFGRRATREAQRSIISALSLDEIHTVPLRSSADAPLGLLLALPPAGQLPEEALLAAIARETAASLERLALRERLYEAAVRTEQEVASRTADLRAEIARLRVQDENKDNFLANVSHELRSPLVTMLGYTDLLLTEKLGAIGDRQRQCLQVARSSGKRLKQFIEELMDFSRFELTRTQMRSASFEVRELFARAVEGFTPKLLDRRISVRQRIARNASSAFGDRERILQVLANLLSNAERHCRDGGRITLSAELVPGAVAISVQDDGSGIAPEHQARIFERLYQVGDTKGASKQGLGLGLNIVKSIVEAHDGSVTVASRIGQGATFTFTLPLPG